MSETKTERVQRLLLLLWESDKGQHYADVTGLENDGSPLPDPFGEGQSRVKTFAGGIAKGVRPGQILKFDTSPDGKTIFYDKKGRAYDKLVGVWKNQSDVARWRAEQDATDAERKAKAALSKDTGRKYHLEVLDDLRDVYRKLPAPARAQLLAIVVRYLVA